VVVRGKAISIVGDLAEDDRAACCPPPDAKTTNRCLPGFAALRAKFTRRTRGAQSLFAGRMGQSWAEPDAYLTSSSPVFRRGRQPKLMTAPLPRHRTKPEPELAHRLLGNWHPATQPGTRWSRRRCLCRRVTGPTLLSGLRAGSRAARGLGDPQDWRAEWKGTVSAANLDPARRRGLISCVRAAKS